MTERIAFPERYQLSTARVCKHPKGAVRNICRKSRFVLAVMKAVSKREIVFYLRSIKRFVLKRPSPIRRSLSPGRTVKTSKAEYDAMGNTEHQLYDENVPIDVDCAGVMISASFRDVRDYTSKIIGDRVQSSQGRFLDFGSGNGFNARALSARFPEARITCIDISASRIEYARKWIGCSEAAEGMDFAQMDGANLAFPDNSFDFVFSCHTLEQMESVIHEAVGELVRVMKYRAVLVEPIWEHADLAQRCYIQKWDYARSILRVIREQPNVRIVEIFKRGLQTSQGNSHNSSSVIVLEKVLQG